MDFRPEGCIFDTKENQYHISSEKGIIEAIQNKTDVEAKAVMCTSSHDLVVDLPFGKGIIPREEGAVGIAEGITRDIALISRVNRIVRFKILALKKNGDGHTIAILSRKASQLDCISNYISELTSGDIIDARVTHIEHFGAFVDIGCGIPSLIPIDSISVSRISHPSDRFYIGQDIKAVVKNVTDGRVFLSHKELLGTWEENADKYAVGETVSGIVRSVEDYGIFVELAPNLAGLAESKEGIAPGEKVSVYIKAIILEKMKVKLIIVDSFSELTDNHHAINYFISAGKLTTWRYSPDGSNKKIITEFK
ncbi:MAG: S1 RNA-binding domain-containing protein [Ruminococcus sp.]|nr:S1 RNA-binding domain-containing protein [Ruminococcus sp.]